MPRRPRITLSGIPHHVIQRGNNRQVCFYSADDYLRYLEWLEECARETSCKIHAYVLMTNHVHLLVTPENEWGLAQLMKGLGQRYVQYINRTYDRSGTLWEGRFRSCIAGEANYILACHRYIELNPVRAHIVEHPAEYYWSSYRANGQGEDNEILTPHSVYQALASNEYDRRERYRTLFYDQLDSRLIDDIRGATNSNHALGSEKFVTEIESALGRRARPGKSGRPRKKARLG